ncbi:MAG: ABC transporter ATP-binding protein [Gammaproteobacteria bacterium]|nr:ABC transporter ATP-binding protein [Gammaproteobacteria bacterium]
MIKLKNINRIFQVGDQQVHALKNITLDINSGEYLSIMGPSGSGKSTLLNIIGMLDQPDSGSYHLQGKEVTHLTDNTQSMIRSSQIGFIFQFFHLLPRLTAAENIALPMMLAGVPYAERKQRTNKILQLLEITERADHKPEQLSGGQRQRVAIGRATIMQPKVLLADEPTGNLDRHAGHEVIKILEQLNQKGITLIIVTHDPELGERAKRKIKFIDGSITTDTGTDLA